ncbi:MAG: hypothetical protein V4722_10440 [Bacteroidota bacterium]
MKTNQLFKSLSAFVTLLILSVYSFAQDKKVDIDISTNKSSDWYAQPWVWIVGGAVFILLLVALIRGNSKSSS